MRGALLRRADDRRRGHSLSGPGRSEFGEPGWRSRRAAGQLQHPEAGQLQSGEAGGLQRGGFARLDRRELGLLGLLLAGVVLVRLVRFDLAQVGYDESAAASLALGWPLNGTFPLTGIVSSVGIPNPPAWPYLMAPVLLVWPTPWALVAEGIGLGILAVTLVWWIGRRWLGPWPALAAAAVYGFGFWSTLLGRSPWQPAFLQIPALLCLDALLSLGMRRTAWALPIACGWLGIMVQLHYVALAYVLLVPFVAWLARDVLRARHLAAAVLVGILPLLPFLIHELQPQVGLQDVRFLIGQGAGGSRIDLSAWNLIWTLAGNGGAAGLGGADTPALGAALGRWASLGLLGDVLLAAGLVASVLDGARGRIVAAWVLLPAVVLLRHTLDVLFHYLYIDLPAMAMVVGLLVGWAMRQRLVLLGVLAALALYVGVSVATLAVVLDFVGTHDVYLGYGMPLRFSAAAASAAHAVLPPGGRVAVGGPRFQTQVLRFGLGYEVPSVAFDECGPPRTPADLYLLLDADSPAAAALEQAGAPVLARVDRPGGAYLVLGPTTRQPAGAECQPA